MLKKTPTIGVFVTEFGRSKEILDFLENKKEEEIAILVEYINDMEVSTQLFASVGQVVDLKHFYSDISNFLIG